MNYSRLSIPLIGCMLGALAFGSEDAAQETTNKKPNILVIWGDDIGRFNVSTYNMGMLHYRTPNIDAIGKVEDPDVAEEQIRLGQGIYNDLAALPVPTIAAIHGYCLGGGFETAMWGDFIVAGENAQFGLPEVRHSLGERLEPLLLLFHSVIPRTGSIFQRLDKTQQIPVEFQIFFKFRQLHILSLFGYKTYKTTIN